MTAEELAAHCDVSGPTVYRRLEDLRELDLLEERGRADEDGHHRSVYRSTFDSVTIDLEGGEYVVELVRREPMADRLTDIVEEL